MSVPRVPLAPGYAISRLLKGGWQLAGGHGVVDPEAAWRDMDAFVEAGITTFDCADIYSGVESLLGGYLRRTTHQVQVHTKCVPDLDRLATLTPADLRRTVERSRERLGVDVLDLVQFHWWDLTVGDPIAALHALGALRDEGLVRHIGLTNFASAPLRAILDAGVGVVSHQVQYSLLDRRPARTVAPLCAEHGIGLLCYGALAGGFMHERWLGAPDPTLPLENRSLVKYRLIIEECGGWGAFQALLGVLADVAASHGTGIGAVAIRWVLDQPGVAGVIVGARHAGHLQDSLAALHLVLDDGQRQRVADALAQLRQPPGDVYELERDREGPHGRIMRYNLNA